MESIQGKLFMVISILIAGDIGVNAADNTIHTLKTLSCDQQKLRSPNAIDLAIVAGIDAGGCLFYKWARKNKTEAEETFRHWDLKRSTAGLRMLSSAQHKLVSRGRSRRDNYRNRPIEEQSLVPVEHVNRIGEQLNSARSELRKSNGFYYGALVTLMFAGVISIDCMHRLYHQ